MKTLLKAARRILVVVSFVAAGTIYVSGGENEQIFVKNDVNNGSIIREDVEAVHDRGVNESGDPSKIGDLVGNESTGQKADKETEGKKDITKEENQESGKGITKEVKQESLTTDNVKININTADEEELTKLKGIGPSKARKIATFREENGRFDSIEELMLVPGIKEGTFSKIKDNITVGQI
ncbi:MAG: helix-hairpin-helix domain-containing protein [Lachnospiraceae bacterium]|nr:helix-hairpin-helix domain-containing protein [Lachnospiraceae bacterium]